MWVVFVIFLPYIYGLHQAMFIQGFYHRDSIAGFIDSDHKIEM